LKPMTPATFWIIYFAVVIVAVVYLWRDKFIKRK